LDNVDSAEVAKFASRALEWWDPKGAFRTLHDINDLRVGYVDERARLEGRRVLDVGCGGGIMAEAMALRRATVLGIDLAAENLDAAREHAAANAVPVEYRSVDVEELARERPGGFDVVTCLEMLEHVPEPQRVVAACAALLAPGGAAFFSTLNRTPKSFALAIVGAEYLLGLLPRGTHEYLRMIRPSQLAGWCRGVGLNVADVTGLHLNPLTQRYWLGGNVDVNYFLHARRRGAPAADHA
jgi:2-polyprenyl-6-hydroxyphenyl methylase/3-demethylubiquinone-9 3-methyltransferase